MGWSSDQKSLRINVVKRNLITGSENWSPSQRSTRRVSHAAYVAFIKGFKSKFTYYLRTIELFEDYADPIEELICTSILPSLFGRAEPLPEELKERVNLSPAQGGIGIPDLKRESLEQFNTSLDITAPHVNSIVTQSSTIPTRELMEERKREINAQRSAAAKSWIDRMWRQSHSCNHSKSREVDKSRSEAAYEGGRFLDTVSNGIL